MGKTYVRVDDRLIHGQTIVAWCPTLKIQEIIAIDDVSATNPMLKSILTMGVPKLYTTHIVTTEEAKKILSKPSEKNRLVIVKLPQKLTEIKEEIKDSEQIYLGNMAKRSDTIHQMTNATGIFYLSNQDIEDINAMVNEGFNVIFQQLPNAGGVSWESFTKSIH
jgi:mannose/fructose/N-acetylgalactosamine-specific phosphotransferase system component IIB